MFDESSIDPRFSKILDFIVPGQPHGKGSVRVAGNTTTTRRYGKHVVTTKGSRRGRQDPKSKVYEKKIAMLCRASYSGPVLDACMVLLIDSVKARPARPHKSAIPVDPDNPDGRLYAPVKPDWDNIGKSAADGIEKSGILTNDSRVIAGRVVKMYGAKGEDPFIRIRGYAADLNLWSQVS